GPDQGHPHRAAERGVDRRADDHHRGDGRRAAEEGRAGDAGRRRHGRHGRDGFLIPREYVATHGRARASGPFLIPARDRASARPGRRAARADITIWPCQLHTTTSWSSAAATTAWSAPPTWPRPG